ncbi:hypothetical protein OZX69_01470 [Lactobacillus sp. ESL0731]|uniref:hypothetical protein n=1 Tax=unclassified Lactobacillus TaxID=2620435 RepID=UPI0023F8D4A0|nr:MULTISPECIES: hypothetical protein [unclassified Lactobacillus]WEV51419.1 hypothetical protein OZX63_01470 [Lactobacillus sp. ESL0700]WEV62549.1 hypothetical protein OZX69_01470 [Lactobacillus sp. ESL0731]
MAATTFSKNIKISKAESDNFVKLMTEPCEPLLDPSFKSHMINVDDYRKEFYEALYN